MDISTVRKGCLKRLGNYPSTKNITMNKSDEKGFGEYGEKYNFKFI